MILSSYINQLKKVAGGYLDVIWCSILYGASPNNYIDFEFDKLTPKERSTFVTNRLSRKMIRKFNQKDFIPIFEDKTQFAQRFAKWFKREWISTDNLSYERFLSFIEGKSRFILKPIGNAQGQGIKVFDNICEPKKIYAEIMSYKDIFILEEWIQQHEHLASVYCDAINCLRIITVYKNNTVIFLTGGITWGNGEKIANACASGIVSPVDFEDGIIKKPAADFYGNVYTNHPISKKNIVGFQIPYWKETIQMLTEAAREVPQIGYVGWDVAIRPDGPVIIEGNTTPGYRYYQIPVHMKNRCGNKEIYSACLKQTKTR